MKNYAYIFIPFCALLAMAACKSQRSVVESESSGSSLLAVKHVELDSMDTNRVFSFDELDYWVFGADSGMFVADTAGGAPVAVHVRVKGGKVETKMETKTKTMMETKTKTNTKTETKTETKSVPYTFYNWFIAGALIVLLVLFFVKIRWPA